MEPLNRIGLESHTARALNSRWDSVTVIAMATLSKVPTISFISIQSSNDSIQHTNDGITNLIVPVMLKCPYHIFKNSSGILNGICCSTILNYGNLVATKLREYTQFLKEINNFEGNRL